LRRPTTILLAKVMNLIFSMLQPREVESINQVVNALDILNPQRTNSILLLSA
jgi:hypothetical protein